LWADEEGDWDLGIEWDADTTSDIAEAFSELGLEPTEDGR
jgi:hypothetical protein